MARILVVEDDDLVRSMIMRALERTKHEIKEARNGREALLRSLEFNPSVILMDIMMPEMDGFELIPLLRRQNPSIKIVACSGGGKITTSDVLKTARILGANRVLPKPFSISELFEIIDSVAGA